MYLSRNTRLHQRYRIDEMLGHGGFGITYSAWDEKLNIKVAVKEYLPRQLATRSEGQTRVSIYAGTAQQEFAYGLAAFQEEARATARFFNHPIIVSAIDYFQANGTAYMVMNYVEGLDFEKYLRQRGGKIPFEQALRILVPVLDALREVHDAGLLHRDVSPDNIYITKVGQIKLLDFGAARFVAREHSQSFSIILKEGYAPEEQYRRKGKQGPWTDEYAAAATLYRAITGERPSNAQDRLHEDGLSPPSQLGIKIPAAAEQALLKALAVDAGDRFQDIKAFQTALLAKPVEPDPKLPPDPIPPLPDDSEKQRTERPRGLKLPRHLPGLVLAGSGARGPGYSVVRSQAETSRGHCRPPSGPGQARPGPGAFGSGTGPGCEAPGSPGR